jgi:hypothetical protein
MSGTSDPWSILEWMCLHAEEEGGNAFAWVERVSDPTQIDDSLHHVGSHDWVPAPLSAIRRLVVSDYVELTLGTLIHPHRGMRLRVTEHGLQFVEQVA